MTTHKSVLDMDVIRSIGLAQFSSLYNWPISDDEFTEFVDYILLEFEALLITVDDDVLDITISDYRFLAFIIQHIHYRAAISRQGFSDYSESGIGPTLKSIVLPDWDDHVNYFSDSNIASGHFGNIRKSIRSQIGRRGLYLLNTYKSNPSAALYKHLQYLLLAPQHISIGPFSEFKQSFLRSRSGYTRVSEWDYFSRRHVSPDLTFSNRLNQQFLAPYLDFLETTSIRFGTNIDKLSIKKTWEQRLRRLHLLYSEFRSLTPIPAELSITAAGNPIRKILATALQREGTSTFVLHHGECAGVETYPHAHRNDGSFPSYFVCPTPQITKAFRDNYSDSLISKKSNTQYISSKYSQYEDMLLRYRKNNNSGNGGKIMLVGYGMNHNRYLDGAGYFSYFQLDLQYRLLLLLKKQGHQVIYKVHPDRINEVGALFSPYADHVETRPFQQVWDDADSYVFTHPGTTVFGHVIFTRKPILLIDLKNNNWNRDGYNFLKQRCHMVPSHYDSNNRIIFNETEVIEKLNSPLQLNDEYINRYYLNHNFASNT